LSRGKPNPSSAQAVPTILQRPLSGRQTGSSRSSQAPSPAPGDMSEQNQKPFVPQLLKRPKPEETRATPAASTTTEDKIPAGPNQKDALLALFAKSQSPASQTSSSMPPPPPPDLSQRQTPLQTRENMQFKAPTQSWSNSHKPAHAAETRGFTQQQQKTPVTEQSAFRAPSVSGTPDMMKSRQYSTTSQSDGLRSPGTPVEAKGFLLDYLNGIARGAK